MSEMAELSEADLGIKQEDFQAPEQKQEGRRTRIKMLAGRGVRAAAAVAVTAAAMAGGVGLAASRAEAAQVDRPAGVTQVVEQEEKKDIDTEMENSQRELAKAISDLYVKRASTEDASEFLNENVMKLTVNSKSAMQADGSYTRYTLSTGMGITSDGESEGYDPNKVMLVEMSVADVSSTGAKELYHMGSIRDSVNLDPIWMMDVMYGNKGYGLANVPSPSVKAPGVDEYQTHFAEMKKVLQYAEKAKHLDFEEITPPENVPERPRLH